MDTKLKKMHNVTKLIILFVVLVPAVLLTALYPRMEEAAYSRKQEYELELGRSEEQWYLQDEFPSFAVEATYCMNANRLRANGSNLNCGPLEEYGWVSDYTLVLEQTDYLVTYNGGKTIASNENLKDLEKLLVESDDIGEELKKRDWLACLEMVYNEQGYLVKVQVHTQPGVVYNGNERMQGDESQAQYVRNVEVYGENNGLVLDASTVTPKNMKALFVVGENSEFVWQEHYSHYISNLTLYNEIGAWIPIVVLAVFVALAALLLPGIKKLDTGWERVFCLPFEVICLFCVAGICGAVFMYEIMCCVSMHYLESGFYISGLSFLGVEIGLTTVYYLLLGLNFLGWAVLFGLEYLVVASFRQFLCGPKAYLKDRVLCVRGCKWLVRKLRQIWHRLIQCELSQNLHIRLIIVVLLNTGIVTLLCFLGVYGVVLSLLYGIGCYFLLRKLMETVQKDYGNIKGVVQQIADGKFNNPIPNKYGVFQNLGEELILVKDGFAKAVAEEAKSQNMKTELITNVSHDLKTPLTAIITYVDLLGKEDITEEERKSYLSTLEMKSQRLKVLIEDLFEISKAQSGNVKMNPVNLDVVNLMKQVRTEMEDKIADSNLLFRWNLPTEKVMLYLDGQKTYRVFENLLNNILKYAMPHSRVYIDLIQDGGRIQITFRNISKEEMDFDTDHLADRFVRGEASRSSEGSGLGLAIAKSFVELQGGSFHIDVDGDLFKVTLTWEV